MIVAFRNYFRNNMVNLTALSVKHFVPDAKFYCFSYYNQTEEEYLTQVVPLHDFIENEFVQTKYVTNKSSIHDDEDHTKTSGFENGANGFFFSEGYNAIYEKLKNVNEKVLCLAEDHFFTTGKVLKELQENDFDFAFADTDQQEFNANGSIIAFVPTRVSDYFPINSSQRVVEQLLGDEIVRPMLREGKKVYQIKNRKWLDYCGDGLYTNSSKVIQEELIKAGILCRL